MPESTFKSIMTHPGQAKLLLNGLFTLINAKTTRSEFISGDPSDVDVTLTIPDSFARALAEITVVSSNDDKMRDTIINKLMSIFVLIGFLYSMDSWVESEYKTEFIEKLQGD